MTSCEYVAKGPRGNRITALTTATLGALCLNGEPNEILFTAVFLLGFGSTHTGSSTYKEFKRIERAIKT